MSAFCTVVFDNITRGNDKCDVFLGDHAPHILNCVVKRALTRNDFAISR